MFTLEEIVVWKPGNSGFQSAITFVFVDEHQMPWHIQAQGLFALHKALGAKKLLAQFVGASFGSLPTELAEHHETPVLTSILKTKRCAPAR